MKRRMLDRALLVAAATCLCAIGPQAVAGTAPHGTAGTVHGFPLGSAYGSFARVGSTITAGRTALCPSGARLWRPCTTRISSPPKSEPSALPAHGVAPLGNVFLIIGENTSRSQIRPALMPYLTEAIKPHAAWLTNYYSLYVDGSLANYIGMTSGQYTTCEAHNNLPKMCHQDVNNVFHQMDAHGLAWNEWMESATGPCDFFDSGTDWAHNVYGAHHNPAIYYDDVEGAVYSESKPPAPECTNDVLPAGTTAPNDTSALDAALASGRVGQLNVIIPNDCEQGHDRCGPGNRITQFDHFLRREVPQIEASPAFGRSSVIFITYDEGGDPPTPNRFNVVFAALGPNVRPGSYGGSNPFTHYSLLRTLEDGLGLAPLAGAITARPIGSIWR